MRKNCKVDYENGTKQCADCREVKPLDGFPVRNTGYVYAYCKECNARRTREWSAKNRERKAASAKEWAAKNPERLRESQRNAYYRRTHGISFDEVRSMLEKQSFRCEVCSKEINEDTLVVDHCHNGGHVRGILCNQCNIWLAPLEKDGFLSRALAYLERHRSKS